MEEHRLTPMKEEFNNEVFMNIYKNTQSLKRKLAHQIDCRRLGVDYEEILSWFDVKIIFIFNRYCDKHDEEVLKGHIISGLQFFKQRILRSIYSQKNQINDTIDISEAYGYKELEFEDEPIDENSIFLDTCMNFMKDNLSEQAYEVLKLELNPPPFILNKLSKHNKATTSKIPSEIIADFFGMDTSKESIKIINCYRREIKQMILEAQEHFRKNPVSV
jgi:hypothetical protein